MKNSNGIGLGGATFLVFLILKLTGVIAWSWWWVTAPLWIPYVLIAAILGIAFLAVCYADRRDRKMRANIARRRRETTEKLRKDRR